jgi:hypothetical protein
MAELFNSDLLNDVYFTPEGEAPELCTMASSDPGEFKYTHDMVAIITHVSSPAGANMYISMRFMTGTVQSLMFAIALHMISLRYASLVRTTVFVSCTPV